MSGNDMVAFIVLVVVIGGVIRAYLRRGQHGPDPAHESRLARLEERVKALEAVVGDSSYELKQKLRELEQ